MKHYILIYSDSVYQTDNLTKDHLVRLKQRLYDLIIDTQTNSIFDVETNSWKKIEVIE